MSKQLIEDMSRYLLQESDEVVRILSATDVVRAFYSNFPEIEYIDERDTTSGKVILIFKLPLNFEKQKEFEEFVSKLHAQGVKTQLRGNTLSVLAEEDEAYLGEAKLPDYGGAFDIDPHQYFTKDDIVEFAYNVVDTLNSQPEFKNHTFDVGDVYIVDYRRLVVDVVDEEDNWFSGQVIIDMRKIKVPQDINKYQPQIVAEIMEEADTYYKEFVTEAFEYEVNLNHYSDGFVLMRDGKPTDVFDTYKDAYDARYWAGRGDGYYDLGNHKYEIKLWKDGQLLDYSPTTRIRIPN